MNYRKINLFVVLPKWVIYEPKIGEANNPGPPAGGEDSATRGMHLI